MVLIENYLCKDKHELEARERYWIENTECVNSYLPTRTYSEWYATNRTKVIAKVKEYREANKARQSARIMVTDGYRWLPSVVTIGNHK